MMQPNVSKKGPTYLIENQSEILELQKKQSNVTSPLLVVIRKNLRKSLGFQTSDDVIEQNKEMHEHIQFIKHHNYFLFLVMTRQFDLIREIFSGSNFARERVLADKIEKEWKRLEERNRQIINEQLQHAPKEQPLPIQEKNIVRDYFDLKTMGLSNMDILYYYEVEIKRIEKERYTEKYNFLKRSFLVQDAHINNFMDAVHEDPKIAPGIKEQFNKDKTEYIEKRDGLMNALQKGIHDDASPAENKAKITELLETQTVFLGKVSDLANAHPENHKIAEIERQLVAESIKDKEELNKIDIKIDEQLRDIYIQKAKAEETTYLEVDSSLKKIISYLSNGDTNHLDENQLKNFDSALADLKEIKNSLLESCSTKEIHEVIISFQNKIKSIENFIKPPLLTKEQSDELDTILIQLHEKTHYAGSSLVQTELHRVANEVQRGLQEAEAVRHDHSEVVVLPISNVEADLSEQDAAVNNAGNNNYSSSLKEQLNEIKPGLVDDENLKEEQIQLLSEQFKKSEEIIQDKIDAEEIPLKKMPQANDFIKFSRKFMREASSYNGKVAYESLKKFKNIPEINNILKIVEPIIQISNESQSAIPVKM